MIEAARGGRRNVLVSAQPIRDQQGAKIGAVVAMQDVTERKNLERQFHHVQKMEALGHLAAGVAHDFNNLITVISGHTALLKRRIGPDDGNHRGLAAIDTAAQQATRLTRQLLAFGRRQVLQPKVMDLNVVLSDTRRMLERIIGGDVTLTFLLASDLDRVTVDAGQVEQILMNLIVNALDSCEEGGRGTRVAVVASAGADGLHITVEDDGPGVPSELAAQIFEPMFTTRADGTGSGLGLAISRDLARGSFGGDLVLAPAIRGARFELTCAARSPTLTSIRPEWTPRRTQATSTA